MLMEFITRRNTYGHRNYIAIDADNKTYTTTCKKMIPEGIEINKSDYRALLEMVKNAADYKEI